MELFETIAKRYSYRGDFTDAPVPRADLRQIVGAGIQAPSACNKQVASFVIVDDPQFLAKIVQIVGQPGCKTAKAMIACIADPRPVYKDMAFPAEDTSAAVENILLAITALGYATVWLDGVLRVDDVAQRIGRLLGVPAGQTVRVILPVGVPAVPGEQLEKLPFERRAWFNRHGG